MYENCRLCPRNCGVNRNISTGICSMPSELFVARAALHMWEEPCISGTFGSGTVFFSGCSLRCVYCQNKEISEGIAGKPISTDRLCDIFIELQYKGAHNINLVTPDHYAYHIIKALETAKSRGLAIPVVYNTSGYCNTETLKMFDGLVDIYLTDFKYFVEDTAKRYSSASDYPEVAKSAMREMKRQQPDNIFENNLMKNGVIVRHLVLPNNINNSKKVLEYLYKTYGDSIYISIMNQFTPNGKLPEFSEINRRVTKKEYNRVVNYAVKLGISKAFIQEGETAVESFIPPFDNEGV